MSPGPALQLRVHGVGGPQAPKMLGVLEETDTLTLAPVTAPIDLAGAAHDVSVPVNTESRVVHGLDDDNIEAYEWGGLTLGGLLHSLWVVYLPLTILNAAGWSRRPGSGRPTRIVMHVLCVLGTVTYVGWLGYIFLDIVGRQWRDHIVLALHKGAPADWVRCAGLPLAHVLFFATLGAVVWVNATSGKSFENVTYGEPDERWAADANVFDQGFFAHVSSYRRLRLLHYIVVVVAAAGVVVLGAVDRRPQGVSPTSIGLGLVILAFVQLVILTGWWLSTPWTGGVSQVTLPTIGTVLCHAAFAGTAIRQAELVILVVLRKPRESAPGRIVGNVWDVLTFWPRRYHPFGVPPYAERAVPELRLLVRESRRADRSVVALGHSQGSVLLFAALGAETSWANASTASVSLVTFGSPLGTLYSNAFPAYFGPSQRQVVAARITAAGGAWRNLFRSTDAISGPLVADVISNWTDVWIQDPRTNGYTWAADTPIPQRPPLERPPQWGVAQGHNRYLADPQVRQDISTLS